MRVHSGGRLRTFENHIFLASIHHVYGYGLVGHSELLVSCSGPFEIYTSDRDRHLSTCWSVGRRRLGARSSFLRKLFCWALDWVVLQVGAVRCVESSWSLGSVSWTYFHFLYLACIRQLLPRVRTFLLALHLEVKGPTATFRIFGNRSFHFIRFHRRSALDHNSWRSTSFLLRCRVILIYHLLEKSFRFWAFLHLSWACSFSLWSLFLFWGRLGWVYSFRGISTRSFLLSGWVGFFGVGTFLFPSGSTSVFIESLVYDLNLTIIHKLSWLLLLKRTSYTFRSKFLVTFFIRLRIISFCHFRWLSSLFYFLVLFFILIFRGIRSVLLTWV